MEQYCLGVSRRHFLRNCGVGLGKIALAGLLTDAFRGRVGAAAPITAGNPLAVEALTLLQESPRRPGEAPVIDADGRPVGLIMLKDLLRCGIV